MSKFTRLGNDLYEGTVSYDFVGKRALFYGVSGLLVLLAALTLWLKPLDMGIEFVGGAEYRVSLPADQVNQDTVEVLRDAVSGTGIEAASAPVVNTSGTAAVLIQTEALTTAEGEEIRAAIVEATGVDGAAAISQSEVGASWGKEVATRALTGVAVFLVLVSIFIWLYFREWKMAVASLIALFHDVVITIGVYGLSGFEVTPATVTGLLTILGFSLYDKVVVFDKVRENTRDLRGTRMSYKDAANLAVNQTLVRSINTSIVAMIPVAGLLYAGVVLLGNGPLKDLALALFVGVAVGLYSSVFIAPRVLVQLKASEKEIVDADRRAEARRRAADRYASVPVVKGEVGDDTDNAVAESAYADESGRVKAPVLIDADEVAADSEPSAPLKKSDSATPRLFNPSGNSIPAPARGPVEESRSSGRNQPKRQPRSKRGK